jgi:phosphatidylserine/phosphatidylglycerophosphate/cardiolipin synthase-like enzyme
VSILVAGQTCWQTHKADNASVIIDADKFFRHARSAMLKAKHSIMLIGWDFDTRIGLVHDDQNDDAPVRVGPLLDWLAARNPDLQIRILKWDLGVVNSLARGETPFYVLKWMFSKQIHLKLDGAHPAMSAHHMKLLVIDDQLAFCGGIDMTVGRWDTSDHRENEPRRRSPMGFAQGPWHDATTCISGPAAVALGELARTRWRYATGQTIRKTERDDQIWPDGLDVEFENVAIGIARTAPQYEDRQQVSEIETIKLAMIGSARKYLYIESQYFASRRIAEAIAARLKEVDGPEVLVINPEGAGGWLEAKTMDSARVRLIRLVEDADRFDRFRILYPVNESRSPIYVHAKIMVADDDVLKLGSANLNNRSMGFDTECDITIEAHDQSTRGKISRVRDTLLAEHLGCAVEQITDAVKTTGSLLRTVDTFSRSIGRGLMKVPVRELTVADEVFAESDFADPERPAGVKYRTASFLQQRLRRPKPLQLG